MNRDVGTAILSNWGFKGFKSNQTHQYKFKFGQNYDRNYGANEGFHDASTINVTKNKNKNKCFQNEKNQISKMLPKIINCNPQSLYNKSSELITLLEQRDIDLAFISKTWERKYFHLEILLKSLESFSIISN